MHQGLSPLYWYIGLLSGCDKASVCTSRPVIMHTTLEVDINTRTLNPENRTECQDSLWRRHIQGSVTLKSLIDG